MPSKQQRSVGGHFVPKVKPGGSPTTFKREGAKKTLKNGVVVHSPARQR
jgi:hypothetical protein